MKTPELEVLICGAGAAGLTLAIDLARRGVRFRLIEAQDRPFHGSRGKGIQPRTQEIFEDLGLLDRLAAEGGPYPIARVYADDGTTRDEVEEVPPPTSGEPYSAPLLVPQFKTEAVLRERLLELGHAVAFGTKLLKFTDDGEMVTAQVESTGQAQTITSRFLIGADGGRSLVRHELNIGFPGQTLGVRAIVADMELEGLSRDRWHRFNNGDMRKQLLFCPLPRTALFQLQAPIPAEGAPDLNESGLQRFVDERLPNSTIRISRVHWASAYAMNARLADQYRVGNVFLIGDAAHIHPPTGGQGLNTSVQDAYNLGWKLAAVLDGAPAPLLDTYEAERRPIAADVLGLSTRLLDKAKVGDIKRGREVRQLDLSYRESPLSVNGATGTELLAGDRLPDCVLMGAGGRRRRMFDLIAGPQWTILHRASPIKPRKGIRILRIGADGEVDDTDNSIELSNDDVLIIRPDGYLGARFHRDDSEITEYLDRVLPPGSAD